MGQTKYEKHHCMLQGAISVAIQASSKVKKDTREDGYAGPMDPQIATFLKRSLQGLEESLDSWS